MLSHSLSFCFWFIVHSSRCQVSASSPAVVAEQAVSFEQEQVSILTIDTAGAHPAPVHTNVQILLAGLNSRADARFIFVFGFRPNRAAACSFSAPRWREAFGLHPILRKARHEVAENLQVGGLSYVLVRCGLSGTFIHCFEESVVEVTARENRALGSSQRWDVQTLRRFAASPPGDGLSGSQRRGRGHGGPQPVSWSEGFHWTRILPQKPWPAEARKLRNSRVKHRR